MQQRFRFFNLTFLCTVLLLALFAWLGVRMIQQAPAVWMVNQVLVHGSEEPVYLGRHELGHRPTPGRSAAINHLQVQQDALGWWFANVAENKRVDAPTRQLHTRYLKRWPLEAGDRIQISGHRIDITELSDDKLVLETDDGRRALWQDGRLQTDETPFTDCPPEGSAWWKRVLTRFRDRELRLFSIGGLVPCARRWPLPDVPAHGLWVLWYAQRFWLGPGYGSDTLSVARANQESARRFTELVLQVDAPDDPIQRVVLGRAQYRVNVDDTRLILQPLGGADVWREDEKRPQPRTPQIETSYQARTWIGADPGLRDWLQNHWQWPLGGLLLALFSALVILKRRGARQTARRTRRLSAWPVALLGASLTLGLWRRPELDAAWMLLVCWLAWAWSSVLLWLNGRLHGIAGWLWAVSLFLVGSGALTLGQLAAGGDHSRWLDFAYRHWGMLALAGWLLAPLTTVSGTTWRTLLEVLPRHHDRFIAGLRLALPLLLAAVLVLQVLLGKEEGLAGFQPVEAAKLVLVFMLAYAGTRLQELRRTHGRAFREHPLRFAVVVMAYAVLFLFMADTLLWAVNDWSPALLLAFLLIAFLWRLAPAPAGFHSLSGRLLRLSLLLAGLSAATLLFWVYLDPGILPHWFPQYDRLQVWAYPWSHPHSGMQVLRSLEYSGAGGWYGASPSWFGWNGEAIGVPAIQDDFIGAFLLYRFGALAGLTVLAVQLFFLGLLFELGRRVNEWRGTQRQAGEMASLALYGLAWLFAAHWLIAWGNVLGLLPVMGQPMTWLSAGNSHLLLFAFPGLAFALVVAWAMQSR